jgi:ABC-type branched-subunit amino acid transport system substrate-binding protein
MKYRTRSRLTLASLAASVLILTAACGNRADKLPVAAGVGGQSVVSSASPVAETSASPVAETAPAADSGTAAAPAADAGTGGTAVAPVGGSAATPRAAASAGAASPKAGSAAGAKAQSGSAAASPSAAASSGGSRSPGAGGSSTAPLPGQPGGDQAGTVKADGPNSQGVSDTTIRVGVLAPISGAAGFLGENEVDGVRASLELINSRGGVQGRKYQMIVVDTQFEPAVEATGMKRLVEQDKVFAVISVLGDSTGPYVTAKGIPVITFGIVPPAFASKYPTTYPVGLNTVDSVASMAYQLTQVLKLPIKSTAVLFETQNLPIQKWAKYMQKAWEIWGVQVKSVDKFNLSDADCTQLVIKMRDLQIDFWQLAQSLGWPICQQAMNRQNYTPPQGRGGPYTADEHFVGQAGLGSDGVYAETPGVQIVKNTGQPYPYNAANKAPAVDDYLASMKKFSPSSTDPGSLENIWTQQFWAAGKLLDDAIRHQSGAITWKGVNQWIQSQKSWTAGLSSPMNFTPNCKTGAPVWIFQWKAENGKLVQSDWKPYGGPIQLPTEAKDKIAGGGDCYLSRMADAEL